MLVEQFLMHMLLFKAYTVCFVVVERLRHAVLCYAAGAGKDQHHGWCGSRYRVAPSPRRWVGCEIYSMLCHFYDLPCLHD